MDQKGRSQPTSFILLYLEILKILKIFIYFYEAVFHFQKGLLQKNIYAV